MIKLIALIFVAVVAILILLLEVLKTLRSRSTKNIEPKKSDSITCPKCGSNNVKEFLFSKGSEHVCYNCGTYFDDKGILNER